MNRGGYLERHESRPLRVRDGFDEHRTRGSIDEEQFPGHGGDPSGQE